jgi:hypothetical protein
MNLLLSTSMSMLLLLCRRRSQSLYSFGYRSRKGPFSLPARLHFSPSLACAAGPKETKRRRPAPLSVSSSTGSPAAAAHTMTARKFADATALNPTHGRQLFSGLRVVAPVHWPVRRAMTQSADVAGAALTQTANKGGAARSRPTIAERPVATRAPQSCGQRAAAGRPASPTTLPRLE